MFGCFWQLFIHVWRLITTKKPLNWLSRPIRPSNSLRGHIYYLRCEIFFHRLSFLCGSLGLHLFDQKASPQVKNTSPMRRKWGPYLPQTSAAHALMDRFISPSPKVGPRTSAAARPERERGGPSLLLFQSFSPSRSFIIHCPIRTLVQSRDRRPRWR